MIKHVVTIDKEMDEWIREYAWKNRLQKVVVFRAALFEFRKTKESLPEPSSTFGFPSAVRPAQKMPEKLE